MSGPLNTDRTWGTEPRGQAMVETLLVACVLMLLVAGSYQMFFVNHRIYQATAHAHYLMFQGASQTNNGWTSCDTDSNALVIWTRVAVPEVVVPVFGFFRSARTAGGPREVFIRSLDPADQDPWKCPEFPCKRTKMAAGTRASPAECYWR